MYFEVCAKIMKDQAEKLREMVLDTDPKIIKNANIVKPRVIAVTSGKGGVGKTNCTVNLALSLALLNKRVLIVDADFGTCNVDVIMGCSTKYNLFHAFNNNIKMDDIVADGPLGIRYLSGGSGIYELANLSEERLNWLLAQITQLDNWADIILIDTGAGINRNVLKFVMAADEVLVITTPEPTAITDAYAMIKAYLNLKGTAPLKIVVNRVQGTFEGQNVVEKLNKVASKFLGLPVESLGYISEDSNLQKAVRGQSPLLLSYPNSSAAKCIDTLARKLINTEDQSSAKGIKGFFQRLLGKIR